MLSKSAYHLIASVIAGMPSHAPSLRAARRSCYLSFVEKLSADNPGFDAFRFKLACDMGNDGERLSNNKADEG